MKQIVYVFCTDLNKDPVASHVLEELKSACILEKTDLHVDGHAVMQVSDTAPNTIFIVETNEVASHDYGRYAPKLNELFGDADLIGLVNWHEGANAPEAIFSVQTTGDMGKGAFSPVDPRITRSLLLAIEDERVTAGLDMFRTLTEATHWSGTQYGYEGDHVTDLIPSAVDLEIGSLPSDWSNRDAARVLAKALLRVFERADEPVRSLFCIGGVHFEPSFTTAALEATDSVPLAVSHILPNQWLVSEGYDAPERLGDLKACVASIKGGVDAVVFHNGIKACYKDLARQLANELGVPAFPHKRLKRINDLPF